MKADYPPLILLKNITARMPTFWQMLDYAAPIARKAAGCSERVYAPSEAATAAGMRRGHWHHFWTGPMDNAQDRKLVLKWLPPIFVGSSQDGEMPVTLHKVKL